MGLFDWLRARLFGRLREDPAEKIRYILPVPSTGIALTPDEALSLSVVWACIKAIAESLAACRWNIYEPQPGNRRELLEEHPTSWLLNTRPNPEITAIAFREAMLFTAIPFGNAYAEIVPDGAGRLAQLWPLDWERVTPKRDKQTGEFFYEYRQPDGVTDRISADRIFHLRGPGLSGLLGDNVIARAAKALSVAAALERYAGSFFGMGAHPSGILKSPGKVDADTAKRLKDDWAEKRSGPENAHKPLILEAGWEWKETSTDPQKSQAVESRQFSVEEICRWFGVPPHKVGHLLHATFSNIEHQSIEFVRDALTPWARRLEQEADYKFFQRRGRGPWLFTCIDTAPLSMGDMKSRADAYSIFRQNGVMTANEIREREGMNHVGDEGDVLIVQSNMTTIEQIQNPPEPTAPTAPALPPGGEPNKDDSSAAEASYAVAREAVIALFAGAFERYAKRIAARRADLVRHHPPERVEAMLAEEREKLRPQLLADCEPAFRIARIARVVVSTDALLFASQLDTGAPPQKIAELAAFAPA